MAKISSKTGVGGRFVADGGFAADGSAVDPLGLQLKELAADVIAMRAELNAWKTQVNLIRADVSEVRQKHNATDTAANAGGSQAAGLTSATISDLSALSSSVVE